MRLIALLIAWLALIAPAANAQAQAIQGPRSTARIEAELVPMSAWVAPGSTAVVAIRQRIQPGWHT